MSLQPPPLWTPPPLPRPPNALPPLDLGLLAELPSLSLQARCVVDGFLNGRHRSPQKGSSVEFAEYRDYCLGDDLRRVDWRLFGRTDRLHVKQYEEETQLRVFLVLDTSASMDFQSKPSLLRKIEFARIVIASLALLAQRQSDAFGLGLAGIELSDFLRARSSPAHWRSLIGRLEAVAPSGETALAKVLHELSEVIPRRSMIVIASDFYEDIPRLDSALQRLRSDKHDVIGLQVLDPLEVDFALEDSGTFIDVENGRRLKLDAPSVRKGYLERFNHFCAELEESFRRAGGEIQRFRTDEDPVGAFAGYLAKRERRL